MRFAAHVHSSSSSPPSTRRGPLVSLTQSICLRPEGIQVWGPSFWGSAFKRQSFSLHLFTHSTIRLNVLKIKMIEGIRGSLAISYILMHAGVFTKSAILQIPPFIQQIFIEQLLRAVSSIGDVEVKKITIANA